jgi:DnaK suppressor protein
MSDSAEYDPSEIDELLAHDRARTMDQIVQLSGLVGEIIAAATDVAVDDEHDPEGQTIAFERAQAAALLDQARDRLADIDAAITRLRNGTYGICERCGQPIAADRLEARPAARTCIACASRRP